MSTSNHETQWVTAETLSRLREELDSLRAGRTTGAEGAQSIDARIREIEHTLKHATVEEKPDDGLVEPGMQITVRLLPGADEHRFLFGSRELLTADSSIALDVYSPSSPLGEAINGKHRGDTVSYLAPSGASVGVEILDAVPFRG